ncbi:MAG TPA: hypothetical protein VGL91_23965 [Acidobacteriota bacterium]|jgi:hypothetical protein
MAHFLFPPDDDTPNVFLNPRWLAVPVQVLDGVANCYISGTGVADFTADPPWRWRNDESLPLIKGKFKLTFTSDSPLQIGDLYIAGSGIATVAFAHVDRDTDADTTPFVLALDTVLVKDVKPPSRELKVEVTGAYLGDCWMDKIAYQIGMLVYRPSFC